MKTPSPFCLGILPVSLELALWLLLAIPSSQPQAATGSAGESLPGWKLVWSDEFNASGPPNPDKWSYEVGLIRNREKQYYTRARPENARVKNGRLIIEAHREPYENAEYTSASLTTLGHAGWTYGRIEVRAQLPQGRGVWPAIWTLGENRRQVGWPACGEIDVMEYVGYQPHTIHANVHTKKYNHVRGTGKGDQIRIPEPYADFHLYAIEWTAEKIDFFVDQTRYFTFRNEGTGTDVWPFDAPQVLKLNLAIGGSWGGREGIDDAIFPQRFLIDYVRVYQRPDTASPR